MTELPTAPPIGFITFQSDDPAYKFTARLGDGVPNITNGFAGWVVQDRLRRRGLTEWKGNDPLTIDIPVLFDHFISGDGLTCEAEIRQLEKMAGLERGLGEPPIVHFNAAGAVPHDEHDASALDWVISGISFGAAELNKVGNRIRQACTISVMEYVEDDLLRDDSSAAKNRKRKATKSRGGKKAKGAAHKTHHVQTGETLSTIARDELGDASRWREIAVKNPKAGKPRRDPKSVTVGETLKMP